jgi:fluoroacetyl-CoA thioesterase
MSDLQPGLEGAVERTVEEADTARALGSGEVDVLGTPAVVAMCEAAAVAAVARELPESQTTVGGRIDIEHQAPTLTGRLVRARARLEQVDGRRLAFSVEAEDDAGTIARGTHLRFVVDRDEFLRAAAQRG